ncbi:hypothetical protein OF83DRAFT_749937 [Amylostereum chailletii]|nr:hypothetical protein OF83DRAFT_749937 [Amylostereum chailletii]
MPQHEGNALLQLPAELILKILGLLDVQTLLSCQLTSHILDDLIRNDVSLQYSILLFACGMHRGSGSSSNLKESLERLRAHEEAWRNLRPTAKVTLDHPLEQDIPWPQTFMVSTSNAWPMHYTITQLPSALRSVPERQWSFTTDLDILHVDISQDLMVCADRIG